MTSPIEEHDVDVPLRLQPVVTRSGGWRGRSINLIAVGLVGFVALAVVLATALDDGAPASSAVAVVSSSSPSLSPTGSRRPTPPTPTRAPLATPLPTLEVNVAERPTERRLVMSYGQQILDLQTGELRSFGRQYEDKLWPDGDEFVCVCLVRESQTARGPLLRISRFDLTGAAFAERDLLSLADAEPVPGTSEGFMSEGFTMTAAFDVGRRRLIVLDTVRRPPDWEVELHVVDARSGDLLDSSVIGTFPVDLEQPGPSASPRSSGLPDGEVPDGVYARAGGVALAPDGASAFVTVARSDVREGQWTNRNLEWIVPIVDDRAGSPQPVLPEASLSMDRWCLGRPEFLDGDLIVQVCGSPSALFGAGPWSVRRLTVDGASSGDLPIGATATNGPYSPASLVDRARRSVLLWDAFGHLVSRVNVDDGRVDEVAVPESMLPGDRRPSGREWMLVEPGLVASADGARLYALGRRSGPSEVGTSTGIWVFDAETLELLDRWEPRALLTSLAVSADGRFLYAAGMAGYDVDGNANSRWAASVTVYDAVTGEIAVLFGAVGDGQWFSFEEPA